MTLKKKITGRRAGRHALRSSAAVAALVGAPQDATTAHHANARFQTAASRSALSHTSLEWNALRHAC